MEAGLKADERRVTRKERGMRQQKRESERELTAPEVSSSLAKG